MEPYALLALTAPFLLLALACIVAGWWLRARDERGVEDAPAPWADSDCPIHDQLAVETFRRQLDEGWDR